jgi:uncharacterized protein
MFKCCKSFLKIIVDHPFKTILFGAVILFSVSYGMSKLVVDFSYRVWFKESNPKLHEFDAFERRFGSDELAVIIVHSPSGIFDDESISVMTELTEQMWLVPEVIRVDSLSNFQWVHAEGDDLLIEPLIPEDIEITDEIRSQRKNIATNHRSIEGYLVNKKGDTALIYASLKPSFDGTPDYKTVALAIRKAVEPYRQNSDHEFFLTGSPILSYAFQEASQNDMAKLIPWVLGLTILFLFFNLRSLSGVLLTLVVIVSSILTAMGSSGWLGIRIHNLTSIVPQFMIAIAIAVSVHILVTYFQYTRQIKSKKDALYLTVEKNFLPTLLTSISTSIGFFSFLTAEIPTLIEMGIVAGIGTLFSWVFAFLFLVPLLGIIPARSKYVDTDILDVSTPSPFSISFTSLLLKNRFKVIAFYVFVVCISISLFFKVSVNSDPFEYFDESYPLTKATTFVEENVGGALGAEIVIDSGTQNGIKDPEFLKKVETFQYWLDDFSYITKTISIIDILKDLNKSLHGDDESFYRLPANKEAVAQLLLLYTFSLPQGLDINNRVSSKEDSLRLTAMWTLHDSEASLAAIDVFEKKATDLGLNAHVTGKYPLYQSNNRLVVKSFLITITVALMLISILLIIGLGSVRIGLLSLIPNAVPIIVGGSFLPLLGVPLDVGTVIVGSVCLGIAVDDTIHFLTNFNKYISEGDSTPVAIAKVFTHTGPALIVTTMVLVAAFATFIFGTFVPNQNFGKFVAITLSIALVTDLTLLPVLLLKKDEKF